MTAAEKARMDEEERYHRDVAGREKYTYYPGEGQDENGNKVPGTWRAPTQTGTGEEPKFFPGMVQTGKPGGGGAAGGVWKVKHDAWLEAHPDDTQGALDYAGGHRQMGEMDINKAALGMASRELQADPGFNRKKPEERERLLRERTEEYSQILRHGSTPPAAPATAPAPGGNAPAPNAPAPPTSGNPPAATPAAAQPALPAGVPPGSRLQRNKTDPSKYRWLAPDGSSYSPEGKPIGAGPQAAAAP
jgi:hypothetical protein